MTHPSILESANDVLNMKSALAVRAAREELKRILSSQEFKVPDRLRNFLRFVVNETVSGNGDSLKGYTIATRVFGRSGGFDPVKDPIVRIEAGRLRKALERYYLTRGKNSPVRIDIPLGTYVPVFYWRNGAGSSEGAEDARPGDLVSGQAPLTGVAVMPLRSRSKEPMCAYFAEGLTEEIMVALSRFGHLQIISSQSGSPDRETSNAVDEEVCPDFVLSGTVWKEDDSIRVIAHLTDSASSAHLWGECYDIALGVGGIFTLQREIARGIADAVGGNSCIIARRQDGD